jgi:hypothetical protein
MQGKKSVAELCKGLMVALFLLVFPDFRKEIKIIISPLLSRINPQSHNLDIGVTSTESSDK